MKISSSIAIIVSVLTLTSTIHAESTPSNERSFKMELEQKTGKVLNTPARVNHVLSKYGLMNENSRLDAAAVVELESAFIDVEYLGTIGIGSPPQYFRMNLDTGSSDIWVPSEPCPTCVGHNFFHPRDSSSFKLINQPWSLQFGDGSRVAGVTAMDTVHVGNASQPHQIIGLANRVTSDFTNDKFMDGIFGLAWPYLSRTGQKSTIVERLYTAGQIDEPIVGIFLGRVREAQGKGEAVFGGVNPDHYTGEIKYIPVTEKKYWQVAFGGIDIDGRSVSAPNGSLAIIDTGTTLTVLPPPLAQAFHASIPGAEYSTMYGWRVPCHPATNGTITFILGDEKFPVPLADMIRERSSSENPSLCYSGVVQADSPLVIMGDSFLRNYYSVYDYKNVRVGLAPSKA